jgi:membrane protein YqaA with SNARE-associated domain
VLVFVSSLAGIPPFYVMSLVAGALRMNFMLYLATSTAGRLLRFGALVSLPQMAVLVRWRIANLDS